MPWYIAVEFFYLFTLTFFADCIVLNPVNWNASNPMFKVSNNAHVIEVKMNDQIDFSCPHYPNATNPELAEYYVIYKVSKESYDQCQLYSGEPAHQMVVNCSRPHDHTRRTFTITITDFSPIPNAPEFEAGKAHYFITTSSGKIDGINQRKQGACYYKNMKLSIKVCCDSTTTTTTRKSPTANPSTTTSRTTSTTRSTTTRWRWRTTRKYTDKPLIKSTKKTGDNDSGENDTLPKTNPQTSSTISLRTNSVSLLHLMGLLLTNCFTVLLLTNR